MGSIKSSLNWDGTYLPFLSLLQQSNMATVKETLLNEITPATTTSGNKVTIVGIGAVGMACAFSILTQVSLIE